MRCVLIGNYGQGNLGDEAFPEYFQSRFPEIDWVIVSAESGAQYPRLPLGLRSLFRGWWRTLKALKTCDAVVFGGGTLFTDVESVKACFLWGWHAKVAHFYRKPIYFAFQGVGPFRTGVGERIAKKALARGTFLSVRDPESLKRVSSWSLPMQPIETADPVMLLLSGGMPGQKKHLAIIPRANGSFELILQAWESLKDKGLKPRIVSLQPDDPHEYRLCQKLAQALAAPVTGVRSCSELREAMESAGYVITQRFHGAVAAVAADVPFTLIPQYVGDKLSVIAALARESGMQELRERWLSQVEGGEKTLKQALNSKH